MILPPNSVIGIVGGGQLGRMLALAAARLGYRSHVFTDQADSSAAQVTNRVTVAAYDDIDAMLAFASTVDVVTIEFENLPVDGLRAIGTVAVHPSPDILSICQDRLAEKQFLQRLDVRTAPFASVESADDLRQALSTLGAPAVLKTRRMGYDGKGQIKLGSSDADPEMIWADLGAKEAVLEGFVTFAREISVITARCADGGQASYVPVENMHENHILARTIAPAPIPVDQAGRAVALAETIADGLGLVGLLAVEMFQTANGDLLVNELAPRPHNSGHWTIDACLVSQFEQTVRAIVGLPLGATERFADAEMDNLLGEAVNAWSALIKRPNARLHLYGKTPVRPGRKHGHVTTLHLRQP